jgi:nucleoside-diphosphate-sugar epimerase
MATVFVTGASGFIGHQVIGALLSDGHRVWGLSRRSPPAVGHSAVNWVTGCVTDPARYASALEHVDGVIHLAAILAARRASDYERTNVLGTKALLDACAQRAKRLRRVILMSSVAAMGPKHDGTRLSESDCCTPETVYGRSKLAAEHVAIDFADRLPLTIVRPSFVYGPGDVRGATHLQNLLLARDRRWTTTIAELSFVHVSDLTTVCQRALDSKGPSGEVFIVADPESCSWNDLRDEIVRATECLAAAEEIDARVARRVLQRVRALNFVARGERLDYWGCDASKARRTLGFGGSRTFRAGVLEAIRHYFHSGLLARDTWLETSTAQA